MTMLPRGREGQIATLVLFYAIRPPVYRFIIINISYIINKTSNNGAILVAWRFRARKGEIVALLMAYSVLVYVDIF
jgi:hypothetical protein